jgi:lipoyl(octanoyl) transferase
VRSEGLIASVGSAPSAAHPSRFNLQSSLVVKRLGIIDYVVAHDAMRAFTAARSAITPNELWLVEHPPVYTLGQAAKLEHVLRANGIPVIRTDRGGEVTYHGPGQVIAYVLLDLRRPRLPVRRLVCLLEQAVINLLADFGITGERRLRAPGVYIGAAKVAALGLRVRGGCCYHGLALNVDMDLAPFDDINPCGYAGLEVTQLRDVGVGVTVAKVMDMLATHLSDLLAAATHGSLDELTRDRVTP